MGKGAGKSISRAVALVFLCLFFFSLNACARSGGEDTVYCNDIAYTSYPALVARMLPSHRVDRAYPYVFTYLDEGAAAEAFDAQAVPALENGVAKYWYPQYLATVVIAVDRDRTGAPINGWRDLPAAGEEVGVSDIYMDRQMVFAAIAYGLEGEDFTLDAAADLLEGLRAENHLVTKSFEPAIVICYDFQAAELAKSGRNLEVIVPREGTLTYQKGLLSNTELRFTGDVETLLLAEGFRLPDGRCDAALYPDAAAYKNADAVKDYAHLNAVCQDVTRVLRRNVLHTRVYSSADQREHQFFVLLYIVLVVIWTASVIQRAMQKGVRRAALLTGMILLGWITLRLIKYQFAEATALNRYLWYGFYLFQLTLPLVLLWLAWVIDKPDESMAPPTWLRVLSVINGTWVVFVLTNDLHNWVFRLDLNNPNWSSEYGYGVIFYFVSAAWALPLMAAIVILVVKSGRNPRKKGFIFPLAFCVLLVLYGFGYVMRVPVAWDSDYTMVVGLFTLFFLEACLRTGMIPVNAKYAALFTHSPLRMQILDNTGQAALCSAHGLPAEEDEDTLYFSAPITGGTVCWQEDIAGLNRLHAEMEESVRKLTAVNAVLDEEEKIKRAVGEENAKTQLMAQLEAEIAGHIVRLSTMIERREMPRIALLLTFLKRRCNLFFRERETETLPAAEWTAYLDELAEMAEFAGVKSIVTNEITARVPVRLATLFYDFFYSVMDWAAQQACPRILVHLRPEKETVTMRLLPSVDARSFVLEKGLGAAISSAGGVFALKDLDDAVGISLSFPKGGERND